VADRRRARVRGDLGGPAVEDPRPTTRRHAYAVWTGLGSIGVVTLGVLLFDEPLTLTRVACIGLIVADVVGLRIADDA
jgi:hypothetical protein